MALFGVYKSGENVDYIVFLFFKNVFEVYVVIVIFVE